jgi:crossover junction endodeoxyribonuclease RuvC
MAVEDLFTAKNARSALILGHARGVILLAGARVGLPIAEYAPRSVKLAITGNGGSTKEQVRFMIMRILGLKKEPPLDMSDALAVALAHKGRNVMRMKS